jgi:hypothetical protein
MQGRPFGNDRGRYRYVARNLAGGIPLPSRSDSHEVVDRAFRSLKLKFLKQQRDFPTSETLAPQFVHEFTIGLEVSVAVKVPHRAPRSPDCPLPGARRLTARLAGHTVFHLFDLRLGAGGIRITS